MTIRGNPVGIAAGYGMDGRGNEVRFSAGARDFSLLHNVQTVSRVHPVFTPMDIGCYFSGGKTALA
jgi:hypothetical protein